MPGHAFALTVQVLAVAGAALTAFKLFQTRLIRRYPVFTSYLLFRILIASVPLWIDIRSDLYFKIFLLTQPITWIFYLWVVMELCRLVLERHKGLYSLGRWAMYVGMALSVTLSLLSFLPKINSTTTARSRKLGYVLAADRGVTLCMAIFLIVMMFFISRYPVRLSRNIVVHATLFTIFFICNTLNVILASAFGLHLVPQIDAGLSAVAAACLFAWFFLWSTKGEEVRVSMPLVNAKHEERLLYHLDSLNSTLLKIGKK